MTGYDAIGGLVGRSESSSNISNCYAVGSIIGLHGSVGGLVGTNRGTVTFCYSTGPVSGQDPVQTGGLIGNNDAGSIVEGTALSSFWDGQTSGQASSAGGTGLTTEQMQSIETYLSAGWDYIAEATNGIKNIWAIDEGQSYPHLIWELKNPYTKKIAIDFTIPSGCLETQQRSIFFINNNARSLTWELSGTDSCPWLTTEPASGSLEGWEMETIRIIVFPEEQTQNEYECVLSLSTSYATQTIITVRVKILKAIIGMSPSRLDFSALQDVPTIQKKELRTRK